jgi:hypothetical protein
LSTQWGGNYGFGNQSNLYSSEYAMSGLQAINSLSVSSISPSDLSGYCDILGVSDDGSTMYAQYGTNGTVYLYIYQAPSNTAVPYLSAPQIPLMHTSQASVTLGSNVYMRLQRIGGVLYALQYNTSTYAATLKTYNISLTEQSSIALSGTNHFGTYGNMSVNYGILNGILYVMSSTAGTIYTYNVATGAYIGTLSAPSTNYDQVFQFNDQYICVCYANGSNYIYFVLYDGTNWYKTFYVPTSYSQLQSFRLLYRTGSNIAIVCYWNNSNISLWSYLFSPVLHTINNLSTPITKTSSQTMKVSYTISWS